MKNNIVKFPKKYQKTSPVGKVINLYTDEEVDMVLFCLNIFGKNNLSYIKEDLRTVDPYYTMGCLKTAHSSFLLSNDAKAIISYIMKNVTEVMPSAKGGSI